MGCRAILLDMGGVLFDFLGGYGLPVDQTDWRGREALLHFIAERGAHLDLDELESILFSPWREEYRQRYARGREASWDPHLVRLRKRARIRTHSAVLLGVWFRPFGEQLQALPDVRGTLEELSRRRLRLGLISNVPLPGKIYRRLLKERRLEGFFETLHFSYDEGSRKPSPAMLRNAMSVLDVSPSETVMVGDRRSADVAAGRAASVRTVWIRSADDQGPEADHTIDSFGDLPAVL